MLIVGEKWNDFVGKNCSGENVDGPFEQLVQYFVHSSSALSYGGHDPSLHLHLTMLDSPYLEDFSPSGLNELFESHVAQNGKHEVEFLAKPLQRFIADVKNGLGPKELSRDLDCIGANEKVSAGVYRVAAGFECYINHVMQQEREGDRAPQLYGEEKLFDASRGLFACMGYLSCIAKLREGYHEVLKCFSGGVVARAEHITRRVLQKGNGSNSYSGESAESVGKGPGDAPSYKREPRAEKVQSFNRLTQRSAAQKRHDVAAEGGSLGVHYFDLEGLDYPWWDHACKLLFDDGGSYTDWLLSTGNLLWNKGIEPFISMRNTLIDESNLKGQAPKNHFSRHSDTDHYVLISGYGISDDGLLCVEDLSWCFCIAIRDPNTRRTALIRLLTSKTFDEGLIHQVIAELRGENNNQVLDVRLIGNVSSNGCIDGFKLAMECLTKESVDILSANLGIGYGGSFAIDPEDFGIKALSKKGVQGSEKLAYYMRAKWFLGYVLEHDRTTQEVEKAFDLTLEQGIKYKMSLTLKPSEVRHFKALGLDVVDKLFSCIVDNVVRNEGGIRVASLFDLMHAVNLLGKFVKNGTRQICRALADKKAALGKSNIEIDTEDLQALERLAENPPVFAGAMGEALTGDGIPWPSDGIEQSSEEGGHHTTINHEVAELLFEKAFVVPEGSNKASVVPALKNKIGRPKPPFLDSPIVPNVVGRSR